MGERGERGKGEIRGIDEGRMDFDSEGQVGKNEDVWGKGGREEREK